MKTKLGQRLSDIFNLIDFEYSQVWDLCCDHGKLGLALLESKKTKLIHFVDQVPSIISDLDKKIQKIKELDSEQYTLNTLNAENVILKDNNSLICICGVGGDVAIKIIDSLMKNNDLNNHDILISAQYHMYDLRSFLITNNFKLKKQMLSFEGKWGYELLLIRKNEGLDIDPIGKDLIEIEDKRHLSYLNKLISHYENRSRKDEVAKKVLNLYKEIHNQ